MFIQRISEIVHHKFERGVEMINRKIYSVKPEEIMRTNGQHLDEHKCPQNLRRRISSMSPLKSVHAMK
jgi:hypothetical protein